jgi:DNA (cytosine-5)-methyltransferase 1
MKLKVIDLFCGVGGLSYAFANSSKFELIAANDILPDMTTAYSLNHPGVKTYCSDVKDFGAALLEKDTRIRARDIDLIVGGPPCQAYSTVGKRLIDDPRGKLFQEYFRILQEFQPKFFIFENVKGLVSMGNGQLLPTIIDLFESLGYSVKFRTLNAADYGTPQIRERVIITGTLLPAEYDYPEPTHINPKTPLSMLGMGMKPHVTLGEAIGDLPFIEAGEESREYASPPQNDYQYEMRAKAPGELADHNAPRNHDGLMAIMKALPEGGMPRDLPDDLRPKSGFGNTYSRLWWDRPSTTVTRNLGTPSSSRCIHPKVARALTTREGARLQGFPDHFVFYGSRAARNLQIGNAVPTQLSKALASSVARHFGAASQRKTARASEKVSSGHIRPR